MMIQTVRGAQHCYDRTQPDFVYSSSGSSSTSPMDHQGEPLTLIFIHGWLLGRTYWQPVIDQLKSEYPCLAYDLCGFGDSEAPSNSQQLPQTEAYSLQAYAQDLEALMDQLQIGRVWLVGHSLGGSIALWAAHQMGDRVAGVTCVNAGGGIYLKEEFEKFRTAGQQLLKFRPRWLLNLPGLDYIFSRAAVYQNIGLEFGRQRLKDFINADSVAARESLLTSTTEAEVHRLPQLVSELLQPVYFIAGQQDRIMEPRYVRHLASFHRMFQQGNVVELENCGHLAMVEQPDSVAQQIRQTLQQTTLQQTTLQQTLVHTHLGQSSAGE